MVGYYCYFWFWPKSVHSTACVLLLLMIGHTQWNDGIGDGRCWVVKCWSKLSAWRLAIGAGYWLMVMVCKPTRKAIYLKNMRQSSINFKIRLSYTMIWWWGKRKYTTNIGKHIMMLFITYNHRCISIYTYLYRSHCACNWRDTRNRLTYGNELSLVWGIVLPWLIFIGHSECNGLTFLMSNRNMGERTKCNVIRNGMGLSVHW